jgi:hypothetical protein
MSLFPLNVESYTVSYIYSVTKQEYQFVSVCIGLGDTITMSINIIFLRYRLNL